ncbi:MAG: hypothetical protein KAG98_07425 [Lentisphaeria bacterium]|nr:hypothetical protein [Lentisphaeria bacterium]
MAKTVKAAKTGIKSKKEKLVLSFPSKFGTHASMVIEVEGNEEAAAFLGERTLAEGEVLCKDENFYITTAAKVDNGLADTARMYK